jgi:hypothetical protein
MVLRKGDSLHKETKEQPFIYEGVKIEQYKHIKNKWKRLAIVSCVLPIIFASIVSYYKEAFNLLDLFGNGEILLSLFSLTVPMLFDLFEIKHKNDEGISWAFFICLIIVCAQILLYCMTRIDDSTYCQIKSIIVSIIMMVASWISCTYAVKAMYIHSLL